MSMHSEVANDTADEVASVDQTTTPTAHPLRTLRVERGMTREQLAVASGVHSRTIASIELQGRRPQRSTGRAIAAALGVRPEDYALTPRNRAA